MEIRGTQFSIGARIIPSGNLRAARSIYENAAAETRTNTGRGTDSGGTSNAYRVSLSNQGQQLSKADFQRSQQRKEAAFKRQEQREEAAFSREQQQARDAFERQERRKEAEFSRSQQQDAAEFRRSQQQAEARFARQSARYDEPEQL